MKGRRERSRSGWCRLDRVWERSFVAVSVLLGASIDEALAALPEGSELRIAELTSRLRDTRRAVRAQGLAVVAQDVAVALSEVTWR
jgi:hypothetical protein